MNKTYITAVSLLLSAYAYSQVGINNTTPKATLDVSAKTTDGSKAEGIIAPRLTGDQIKAADAHYATDQKGTLIYATAAVGTASAKTTNITAEGYYYFDGSVWQKVWGGAAAGDTTNDAWVNDTANTMVKLGTNADGTARVAGKEFVAKDNGNVGIGTSSPGSKLEINSGTAGASGLKFTNLNSSSAYTNNAATLGVDSSGNVVLQNQADSNPNVGIPTTKSVRGIFTAGSNPLTESPITFSRKDGVVVTLGFTESNNTNCSARHPYGIKVSAVSGGGTYTNAGYYYTNAIGTGAIPGGGTVSPLSATTTYKSLDYTGPIPSSNDTYHYFLRNTIYPYESYLVEVGTWYINTDCGYNIVVVSQN